MSDFTKGPWYVWEDKVAGVQNIVKSDSQMICNTLHGNDEANAALIAASPTMSDILDEVLSAIHNTFEALDKRGIRDYGEVELNNIRTNIFRLRGEECE